MTILEMEKFLADPKNIPPELLGFVCFDIDLGAMTYPSDHPNEGELVFPEFEGEYTPLWEVDVLDTPIEEEENPSNKERKAAEKASRIQLMIDRQERGLDLFSGKPADLGECSQVEPMTPQQKETYFFASNYHSRVATNHRTLQREMEYDPQD